MSAARGRRNLNDRGLPGSHKEISGPAPASPQPVTRPREQMPPNRLAALIFLAGSVAGAVMALVAPACGHDVPNRFFDRAIQVVADESRLYVLYDLSISELTLAEELMSLIGPGQLTDLPPDQWLSRFAAEMAPLLADGIIVKANGKSVRLQPAGENHDLFEGHPRFRFRFIADLPPVEADGRLRLQVEDTNFFLERGAVRMALAAAGSLRLIESTRPQTVDEVRVQPDWQLTPEELDAMRRVEAVLCRTAVPGARSGGASPRAPTILESANEPAQVSPDSRLARLRQLLAAQTSTALLWSLVAAFLFGAAHALTPGHGKTVSAAFLVAGRGRVSHALALAGTVVIAHTGSVFTVAIVLAFVSPALDAWFGRILTITSGVLLVIVGVLLMLDRLGLIRRAAAATATGSLTWMGVVSLGLAAGIVPCWDAVALMLWALAVGRAFWGLVLLISFAGGLAAVLIAIAVLAVRVPHLLEGRMQRFERTGRYIAIAAAVCITGVGGWLVASTLLAEAVSR